MPRVLYVKEFERLESLAENYKNIYISVKDSFGSMLPPSTPAKVKGLVKLLVANGYTVKYTPRRLELKMIDDVTGQERSNYYW